MYGGYAVCSLLQVAYIDIVQSVQRLVQTFSELLTRIVNTSLANRRQL